jgi:hypothetical protein
MLLLLRLLFLQPLGDIEPEAQKLLERCEQLLDIALSTDINAGAGAVSVSRLPLYSMQCVSSNEDLSHCIYRVNPLPVVLYFPTLLVLTQQLYMFIEQPGLCSVSTNHPDRQRHRCHVAAVFSTAHLFSSRPCLAHP